MLTRIIATIPLKKPTQNGLKSDKQKFLQKYLRKCRKRKMHGIKEFVTRLR
jgi:hypothetical protein